MASAAQGRWPLRNSPGFIRMISFTVAAMAQNSAHNQMQEEGKVLDLRPFFRTLVAFPMTHNSLILVSYKPGLQPVPGP